MLFVLISSANESLARKRRGFRRWCDLKSDHGDACFIFIYGGPTAKFEFGSLVSHLKHGYLHITPDFPHYAALLAPSRTVRACYFTGYFYILFSGRGFSLARVSRPSVSWTSVTKPLEF